jgi:hypothetical protein
VYVDKAPDSLLRSDGKGSDMRAKFEKMIRAAQNDICASIEKADGACTLFVSVISGFRYRELYSVLWALCSSPVTLAIQQWQG